MIIFYILFVLYYKNAEKNKFCHINIKTESNLKPIKNMGNENNKIEPQKLKKESKFH